MNINREYLQGRIYHCLRTLGTHTSRQLCERLGLPINEGANHPCKAATQILQKLRSKGLVRRIDHLHWEVVPGTIAPRDQRGKTAGSLTVLKAYAAINIARLNAKRGYLPRPIAKTALEQCWGWLPSPSQACEPESDVVYSSGEVASAENVTPA